MFADVAHADDADAHFVHAAKFSRELISANPNCARARLSSAAGSPGASCGRSVIRAM
jgi:hypothetical protein